MRCSAFILSILFAPIYACATAPDWFPLEWREGAAFAGAPVEKLGLLLPAKIDGVDCLIQVDTGANGRFVWHKASDGVGDKRTGVPVVVGNISLTVDASPTQLAGVHSGKCRQQVQATVGNGFFEHGTLTLDLPRSRFSFVAGPTLAQDTTAQPLLYARWNQVGGHTLVEVRLPSGKTGYALLDTGSARFGMNALSTDDWGSLTGGVPLQKSDSVSEFKTMSWGKQISCYQTMATGPLEIGGSLRLPQYQVSYCASEAFKPPQKLLGVLGLRHLKEHVLVLDYLSLRWKLLAK
ncbi:MAG: hypothetical protein RL748_2160 [Pseudomonadota bacterium]|jgi:hypothetical protein